MPIEITSPVVVPAPTETSYNIWWVRGFTVNSSDPNGKISLSAIFGLTTIDSTGRKKFYRLEDGTIYTVTLTVDDLFSTDPMEAQITQAVLAVTSVIQIVDKTTLIEVVVEVLGQIAKIKNILIPPII